MHGRYRACLSFRAAEHDSDRNFECADLHVVALVRDCLTILVDMAVKPQRAELACTLAHRVPGIVAILVGKLNQVNRHVCACQPILVAARKFRLRTRVSAAGAQNEARNC